MLFIFEKRYLLFFYSIDEIGRYYIMWNNLERERYILYDYIELCEI